MGQIGFGAKVQVSQVYKRRRRYKSRHLETAYWEACNVARRTGLCIGYRTLYNGDRYWEDDVGYVFNPTEHFRAMLVVFDANTNPVYVPLDTTEGL